MKLKFSLALLAAAGLLSLNPAFAQTTQPKTGTPPAANQRRVSGAEFRLQALERALGPTNKLTEAQTTKIKELFEEQGKKLEELRGQPREEVTSKRRAINEETDKKLKEILSPEQLKAYHAAPRGRNGQRGQRRAGQESTNRPAEAGQK